MSKPKGLGSFGNFMLALGQGFVPALVIFCLGLFFIAGVCGQGDGDKISGCTDGTALNILTIVSGGVWVIAFVGYLAEGIEKTSKPFDRTPRREQEEER